jgi:hypothetical protein
MPWDKNKIRRECCQPPMSYLQEVEGKRRVSTDFSFIVATDCYQESEG